MARQLKYEFEIGGKVRVLDFGMYCWELFCEKMNIGPDNLLFVFQGGTTFKAMRLVVYCGIVSNDFLSGRPDSVTEEEVTKILNDSPEAMNEVFKTAMTCFYGEAEKKKKAKQSHSRSKKSKK